MLAGTGVDGLITAKDVQRGVTALAAPASRDPVPTAHAPDSKMRRAIAMRTQASQQTVPHFYLVVDADMTEAQRLRVNCREQLNWERAPTYTDLIVRACALAVSILPEVNVAYTDAGLTRRASVDIGVAVSVDDGLRVPVLEECDRLSLRQISSDVRRLAEQARLGRLPLTSEPHKSLVVSNLGMHGVDAFAAIIDMPDPMILAVGRVAERVIPINGQPMVRPMCTLVLSVDHRALDGVQGARFLTQVKGYLEHATELVETATC
jgi:pyruvate dehydrogenase E2 component (dihydrolipoamide acetyltransferase)